MRAERGVLLSALLSLVVTVATTPAFASACAAASACGCAPVDREEHDTLRAPCCCATVVPARGVTPPGDTRTVLAPAGGARVAVVLPHFAPCLAQARVSGPPAAPETRAPPVYLLQRSLRR